MNTIQITWLENDEKRSCPWVFEAKPPTAKIIRIADDRTTADEFLRYASEGAAFIYRGDFQNGRQLLRAVQKRIDTKNTDWSQFSGPALFHEYRRRKSHRAQILARLLIPVEISGQIPLRRAPELKEAIREAIEQWPPSNFVVSLKDLLGFVGAHEWRKKGVQISALNTFIYPHYGVFAPVRNEYLDLVANAEFSRPVEIAFDIGTGTGVLAALLAKKGVKKVIATDISARAMACAKQTVTQLQLQKQIEIQNCDLFPEGQADLIICNPPWIPARATSALELAIFDDGHSMLKDFLKSAPKHLNKEGEIWLILSDLAVRLELRKKGDLETWIETAGLQICGLHEAHPDHKKTRDETDPLFRARSEEITTLYKLKKKN